MHPIRPVLLGFVAAVWLTPAPEAAEAATSLSDLLSSARGSAPMICALAAHSIGNGFGGPQPPYPVVLSASATIRGAVAEAAREENAAILLAALDDPDACVREVSARLIGQSRAAAVREGLEIRLASPSADTRAAAAYAMGIARGNEPSNGLVNSLRDPSAAVRGNAVWAIGRRNQRSASWAVWRLVRDDAAPVRSAAIQTVRHLEARDSIPLIVRSLGGDPDAEVRRVAAWALAGQDPAVVEDALSEALRGDASPAVREMAAWALADVPGAAASEALAQAMAADSEPEVRATAAWALGTRRTEDALPRLTRALRDADPEVRSRAAWAIGSIEPAAAPEGLTSALRDEDEEVRHRAAWALGQIADSATIPALSASLDAESSDRVKEAILRALLMSGERNEAALVRLLESSSPQLRSQAVAALAGRSLRPWPWPWPWPQPRPFP